jgi:kynurenine formamidase
MCAPPPMDHPQAAQIAALSARPRHPSASPFGPADEIGMLNLATAEAAARVLAEVDGGRPFDLAVDFFVGMPSFTAGGDPPFQMWMSATPSGSLKDDPLGVGEAQNRIVSRSGDAFSMFTHTGTHVDALNHIGYDGAVWNGFTEVEHLASRRWLRAGADRHPPIVARGVLIDVAGLHGVDMLPDSHAVDAADLRAALARQGTELRTGDVVLVRTGRMTVWPDADAFIPDEPGLDLDGARFLAEAGAMLIGADNVGLERHPSGDPESWQPVHTYLLAEAGIPIMEIVDLEELAAGAVHEFAFVGACLKIRGATGSPIRPLALPLRSRA